MRAALGILGTAAALIAAAAAPASAQTGAEQNAARPLPPTTCPLETAEFHPCALERAKTFKPPRTPDGKPDFRGYWRAQHNGAAYDVEPGPGGFAIPATKGIIVDTPDKKIPYTPEALARRNRLREDGFLDPQAHCAPSGAPRKNFTNFGWQIVQPEGYVLFLYESMHDYRVIPTDGRAHLPEGLELWHADPVGHWEGDTLVVDYRNMNGRNWLDMSGNFQTEHSHVVERYTMIDANTIHFAATIDDPAIYTRPFTIVIPFTRNTEQGYYQLEYACHEGERDLQHIDEK
ncbi:MAG TPA: hypothetical protein VFJ95_14735 [Gammaproteobacteria bacterium]|nr:hypothetical protein [Gammaproteobacteria bacterium]